MALELAKQIRAAVNQWRTDGYAGASDISRRLLQFWFQEEHTLKDGATFKFWECQREAIESLIYVYEVCRYHRLYDMAQGLNVPVPIDPTRDRWARYAFKMATGSGKTWVMAMAMVWQYFNRLRGTDNGVRYTTRFLLLAPNLIVMDRLNEAFANMQVFRDFPFVPPEWESDFEVQLNLQSQVVPRHSQGILHLTNIQQLYQREAPAPANPIVAELGPRPLRTEQSEVNLFDVIAEHEDLIVMNDEAHHVHSEDLKWSEVIAALDEAQKRQFSKGLVMQLDFSATPKFSNSDAYFPHIVCDYPLGQAIRHKIVKRPIIGEIENAPPPTSSDYIKRNQVQIDTGVEVYREFRKEFKATGKKPVLFVMTDNTRNADRVGKYLETQKRFKGKVLVIHTDAKGEVTKKDLPLLRKAAREIDTNEYEAIVSVMMLKEGWDVRNVCVIVPLRAFQAAILAEQTLGRGLRRIFPEQDDLDERLVVIEHPRFRELWQAEIRDGDLDIQITSARKVYQPQNLVRVDPTKLRYDLEIPILRGGLRRGVPRLEEVNVNRLPKGGFAFKQIELPTIMYREKDLLEQNIVREKALAFDYTDNYVEYLAHIATAILARVGGSSVFDQFVPLLKDYIERRLLDKKVDITDPNVVRKLNHIHVRQKLVDVFTAELLTVSKDSTPYQLAQTFKVSDTMPFHTSEPVYRCAKSVFEQLPYSRRSQFEREFMAYMDNQKAVDAYTKVLPRFPLSIPYYDGEGILRHYRPDFIVKVGNTFYLVETKGEGFEEMESTKLKAQAARRWCENAAALTGKKWIYAKVTESLFDQHRGYDFETLMQAAE